MESKKSKTVSGADRERRNRSYKNSTDNVESAAPSNTGLTNEAANWSPLADSSDDTWNPNTTNPRVSGADRERRNRSYKNGSDLTNTMPVDSYAGYEMDEILSNDKYELKSEQADTPTGMVSGADRERKNRSYK